MTLTDEQVVFSGNLALRLLNLPEDASLSSQSWPEVRFVETRLPGGERFAASNGVGRDADVADAVRATLEGATNDISETGEFWGVAFPRCIDHDHPASYVVDVDHATLRCPATGHEIRRVTW